jgi:hypothetical protein
MAVPGYINYLSAQPTTGQNWENFLGDLSPEILEQAPQTAYYSATYSPTGAPSAASQFIGASPARQRYFDQSFPQIYDAYQGQLGTAMRQGTTPMRFQDFLETNPWASRYASLPQTARGTTGLYSSPRTRFLYNF